MNRFILYELHFSAPLHIGARGIGYEEIEDMIHSDTLFSAIMSLWSQFYDDDIEALCRSTPFFISSAFPYKGDTYFYPRPMVKIGKQGEDDNTKTGKKLKKVRFISQNLLESILEGRNEELQFNEKNTLQDGKFWIDDSSAVNSTSRVYSEREVPRVTIDRQTNASDIFYFSEVVFEKDAGLFFLVRFKKEEIRPKFETILKLLGDEGIGGDKRMGKGLYTLEIQDKFNIAVPENPDGFLALSLYYPREDEFNNGLLQSASYDLVPRKGWLHTAGAMSLRRKEVRMFREGSVFSSLGKEVYGENPCVLEKNDELDLWHNIYRYGLAFCLPIKREQAP